MTDTDTNAMPLEPDDPRISEWIDGRLPAAEAAAIERAVRATPRLAALVADLRAIKAASRDAAHLAPPAGFADRVMAAVTAAAPAVDHPAGDPSGDEAVDQEWEAVEAERIAAERAEAAVDLAEAARAHRPRPWPWMALVGALAAGVLVTVVLNLPGDGRRDVALAPAPEAEQGVPKMAGPAADLPAADLIVATEEAAADAAPLDLDEKFAVATRSLAAGKPAPPPPAEAKSAAPSPAAPMSSDPSAPGSSGPTSLRREAKDPGSGGKGDSGERQVVAVTLRGPAGRVAFEQRAAALGLAIATAVEGGSRDAAVMADRLARRARGTVTEAEAAEADLAGEAATGDGVVRDALVAISGPADAIERLLAETQTPPQAAGRARKAEALLESADDREGVEDGEAGEGEEQNGARPIEPRLQPARAITRVLVRLIELPAPAEPQPAEPADAGPGDTEP
jgi:hypothetical protein